MVFMSHVVADNYISWVLRRRFMITKIKWNNHVILKNLELDLTKADGTPYKTIVLVGENGTGKTTILETLKTFLNLGSIEPFEYIEYIVETDKYKIIPAEGADFGFHFRMSLGSGSKTEVQSNRNTNRSRIDEDLLDIRHYGCVYSKARSGFNTQSIKTTTTQQLNDSKYDDDNNDNFTFIKQLLVDIVAQDNSTLSEICRLNGNVDWKTFYPASKMFRFENAFNSFFDNMKFEKLDESSKEEKKLLFKKNNSEIPIDKLSTGEKQIVFRGTQLLRNSNNLKDGVVLIDEPELSLHPKWQDKILEYYRNLFTNNGSQFAQIIVATHSEYLLRSALKDRENVLVIVLNEEGGHIQEKRIIMPSVLPTITLAETNYIAFGIVSIDYHIQLYGYLQRKTGKSKIKECDDYIKNCSLYDTMKYTKPSSYRTTCYETLPTYIRNAIDHPDSGNVFTSEELERSIQFLIKLCQ